MDNLYQPLFQYIKKRISNPQDAEDLTQEVFYKLIKSDETSLKSVKSWVYAIAKNTIIDYYRKRNLITKEIDDQDLVMNEELGIDSVAHELSGCIAPFVEQLPADYRQIMKLSELEDIPQKAIAEQLGINYTTLRSKIQRGRKKLKELVTACCSVEQGRKGSIIDFQQRNACR